MHLVEIAGRRYLKLIGCSWRRWRGLWSQLRRASLDTAPKVAQVFYSGWQLFLNAGSLLRVRVMASLLLFDWPAQICWEVWATRGMRGAAWGCWICLVGHGNLVAISALRLVKRK